MNRNINNSVYVNPSPFRGVSPLQQPSKPHIPSKTVYDLTKAGKNGTLITVILDESGSMTSVAEQTIAAFNMFVQEQREASSKVGKGYLTLIKFDAPEIKTVYSSRPLEEVSLLDRHTYSPRGGTNLFDAIGHSIAAVNTSLASLTEEQRPGVLTLIMTDGYENSSVNFKSDEIKNLVRSAENADWTFTFLGANIDAFSAGSAIGMTLHNTASYNTANMTETFHTVSAMATTVRGAKMAGVNTADIYAKGLYSAEDRTKMTGETT
jgi:hypothetical protein